MVKFLELENQTKENIVTLKGVEESFVGLGKNREFLEERRFRKYPKAEK